MESIAFSSSHGIALPMAVEISTSTKPLAKLLRYGR
jgi:hypothetical protein